MSPSAEDMFRRDEANKARAVAYSTRTYGKKCLACTNGRVFDPETAREKRCPKCRGTMRVKD